MTVNPTKTILFEFMMKQKACKLKGNPPELDTTDQAGNRKIIKASANEKCLGATLQSNLQWQAFMETGKDPLIPALRKKLGSLKFLAKNIPRKCKIMLASGLILGKINYLLPVYGGTQPKYLKKIQIIMNNAVRWAIGAQKRTKSKDLMEAANWLDIHEMIRLQTLTITWKTLYLNQPQHLDENIYRDPNNNLYTTQPRLMNTESNLRWRMCKEWNLLPTELKTIQSLPRFKSRVKTWLKSTRTPSPPDPGPNMTQH